MNVLYEEDGGFKVGSVLAATDTSLQVEAPHGKRSKIKANTVLLRFDSPDAGELLRDAEARAAAIDLDFLWECSGAVFPEEFGFSDMAREYCGHEPAPGEAAGILLKLHSAPMYFYRKGKGRYRAAPRETLLAALAGLEKKRRIAEQVDAWTADLVAGRLPDAIARLRDELLYKPDRNKPETRAMEAACTEAGLTPARLLERCGGIASSHDYHLGRFLYEFFPRGAGFAANLAPSLPADLPLATAQAFSVDDADTTEIDDAFSVTPLDDGRMRVGIHIAAPALGFMPQSALGQVARERLSTVYYPGGKITMLPGSAIAAYSLAEGDARPALSLYLDVVTDSFDIVNRHSVVERVPIVANLRLHTLEALDASFEAGEVPGCIPRADALHFLWRFALALEAARGREPGAAERPEYSFQVRGEHVDILRRRRGQPIDKLVAELMILVNSTWGKLLDDNAVAAIYRVQGNGKVRMTTGAGAHQGLGVSHYAWSSSPLRRFVDLVNQWQLLALLNGEAAPFERNSAEMLSAVSDFEATYAAYDDFQRRMERYWCLRWLIQEKVEFATGEVLRDNLVRFERLPLVQRVPSLPDLPQGTRVELAIAGIELLDAELKTQFRRALDAAEAA